MFRLHKQKSDKLGGGDRFDFEFSNLQATQVPKGWDKLAVCIICMGTGKVTCRSSKAPVWRGTCRWTDTLSESIWLATAKEDTEQGGGCLLQLKVVVSTGSSRSGVLGEATVNLADYTSSKTSVPVSLPLEKCSQRTILEMKLQCTTPKMKIRDKPRKDTSSSPEEDYDIDDKSEMSDNLSRISSGSISDHHPDEFITRESISSLSASASRNSLDSKEGEGSFGRERFSLQRNINEVSVSDSSSIIRQDSASSHTSIGYDSPSRFNSSTSKSSPRSRNPFLLHGGPGSSKELVEAVEEVQAEARMWERNSRKLSVNIDDLQRELLNESKEKEALRLELSASKTECTDLRNQIEEVKIQLEESAAKEEGNGRLQKQLEEEVRFLKESNSNLSMQLKKTQESNIELVSVLQEMEENIENQTMEIESVQHKVEELERDCSELTDENLQLVFKLKEMENLQVWNGSSEKESGVSQVSEELSRKDRDREIEVAVLEQELERYKNQSRTSINVEDDLEMTEGTYFITQSSQHEAILKKLADIRNLVGKDENYYVKAELMEEDDVLLRSIDEQLGNLHMMLESRVKELIGVDKVNADLLEKVKSMESDSKCLDDLRNDVMLLRSKLEVEVSSKEVLLKESLELECNKTELEAHLSEVEEENLRLSERICGLEAQLRYLTNEKETIHSALHNSDSRCSKLDEHVREMEGAVEEQKKTVKEMQKQVLEAKEECGFLRFGNQKMQANAEAVIEEFSSLQKSNQELRTQKVELHEQCNLLEAELGESRRAFNNLSEEIDVLREKLVLLCKETSLKERAINAELDSLILETAIFRDSSIQRFDTKIPLAEVKVDKSDRQILTDLAESKMNLEVLMADREKLLGLVEDFKSSESRTKASVRSLEMKLKASEFDRKQLVDDVLRTQVLESEVSGLKRNLRETRLENQRLEASLQVIRVDYETVEEEKALIAERMSKLQRELLELEGCRNSKVALEERVLRLEGDLTMREALSSEEAELKNELARVRRSNRELQRRLHEQSTTKEVDNALLMKIKLVENELAEAVEANNMYKAQLKSFLSSGEGSMEKELRELRESYFNMSLKYALVEAQREELVMKLRAGPNK